MNASLEQAPSSPATALPLCIWEGPSGQRSLGQRDAISDARPLTSARSLGRSAALA